MIVVMPVLAAVLGVALGYVLGRWVGAGWGWGLAAVVLAGALVLVVLGQGRPGMDGLGLVVIAALMAAPAGLGAALGTVLAGLRVRGR